MSKAIEYQVSELKTIWEQFPNILWIKGLGGYIRLGNQNICRITLRKSNIDKGWDDPIFINDEGKRDSNLYEEYQKTFRYYYIGYSFQVLSLVTGKVVSEFYHTWDEKLYCDTLEWEEEPDIQVMLKSVANHYGWIEVWCK